MTTSDDTAPPIDVSPQATTTANPDTQPLYNPNTDTPLPNLHERTPTEIQEQRQELLSDLSEFIPPELRKLVEEEHQKEAELDQAAKPPAPDVDLEKLETQDLDITEDSINRLLDGDTQALAPKEDEPAAPFWHDDEDYQQLSKNLEKYGVREKFDEVIKKVSDKSVVDNSVLVNGIREELDKTTKKLQSYETEHQRLRNIERSVAFENHDETKDKYLVPMHESAKDIQDILDRESTGIKAGTILNKHTRTEMLNTLKDAGLDEGQLARVSDQWRTFKETEAKFLAARNEAVQTGIVALSAKIAPETVKTTFQTGLRDLLNLEDYKYIGNAIKEGITKHPDVTEIIADASTNMDQFVEALKRPTEHMRDPEWLRGFSRFVISAAHNKMAARKLVEERKARQETAALLKKVAVQYQKLSQAAKGVTGKGSSALVKTDAAQTNGSMDDSTKLLDRLDKMAKGDTSFIDSIFPPTEK